MKRQRQRHADGYTTTRVDCNSCGLQGRRNKRKAHPLPIVTSSITTFLVSFLIAMLSSPFAMLQFLMCNPSTCVMEIPTVSDELPGDEMLNECSTAFDTPCKPMCPAGGCLKDKPANVKCVESLTTSNDGAQLVGSAVASPCSHCSGKLRPLPIQ